MAENFLINYHHIGGRGGKFPINIPGVLRDGVHLTMYDADEDCVDEAKNSSFVSGFNKVDIFPFCISDQNSVEDFIITKQPHASSLLESNPEVYPYIRNSSKFGAMRLQEILEPHKIIRLETRKLSSVLSKIEGSDPDFISLDTQGNEYDIILSSKEIYEKALLINAEVSFVEMYKDQKTFPEIHNLMMGLGFILVDLKLYDPHHSCPTPVDFEGKGFLLDGEAFYIKRPDLERWAFGKLVKYFFAAVLCEQAHLCIRAFDALKARFPLELDRLDQRFQYLKLIKDFCDAYQQSYKAYLPMFHESQAYKNYHLGKNESLSSGHKSSGEIDVIALRQNQYAQVLLKYGLSAFAEKIENQRRINIQSIDLISKQ